MTTTVAKELKTKVDRYRDLIQLRQDPHGFIDTDHCDSLLFSGLLGTVPGVNVRLPAAYDPNTGFWHRRPSKDCFPEHSKSTISRDMLIGVLWYAWRNERLDISESIVEHALENWLVMGEAIDRKVFFGRCVLTPGLLSTAAWVSHRLGGPSRAWLRWLPTGASSKVKGFQAHLSVLHGLLRDELTEKAGHTKLFATHSRRQPRNPLFSYADGAYHNAERVLLDETLWPADRLPTKKDRKSGWLLERDEGPDWQPTDDSKVHSGGDFLFVAALILRGRGK